MQKCHFSETQYVFQYVFEHYNKFPFSPFPFFPDTIAEGKYYGFDICIGSLFYQFKICNLFEKKDAKRTPTKKIWAAFSNPCYIKELDLSGDQFKMLKKIGAIPKYRNSVFYVMPEFHTRTELKIKYRSKNIIDSSAHFNINDFPTGLTRKHKLVYTATSPNGYIFSEPKFMKKTSYPQNFENFVQSKSVSLFDTAKELREIIDVTYPLSTLESGKGSFETLLVKETQSILLNDYGIFWFPIIKL